MAPAAATTEKGGGVLVGFRDQAGAYAESAVRSLLAPLVRDGSFCGKSFDSHEAIFKAVEEGEIHCGLVPFETTLAGSLHASFDLLLQYTCVQIVAEADRPTEHCLLALPGRKREDLVRVAAHQSTLRECDAYLNAWGVAVEARTGDVPKDVAAEKLGDTGVIGSELCAETFGLEVLARGIQDPAPSYTRYLLVAAEGCEVPLPEGTAAKTSLVFWLPGSHDALFKVLAVFALRDINLTKMESRPVPAAYLQKFSEGSTGSTGASPKQKLYEYLCYVDVLERASSANMQAALKHLREITPFARVLGSYAIDGADLEPLCKALLSPSAVSQAPPILRGLRIAIYGFGTFGQFLAKEFVKSHKVFATSKSDYAQVAADCGCTWVPLDRFEDLFSVHSVDALVLSTSITSFESVVRSLPRAALEKAQPLIVDVCSVKSFPKDVMLRELPEVCDILCTHPMFGPESGKHGWYGFPFVFEVVRASKWDRARAFLSIFENARCRMVGMSCEDHDKHAAASQFLTHLTGRILAQHGCARTSIDLKSFKSLCKVVDTTVKDSFELFYGLFKYNSMSMGTITKLKQAFADIEGRLRSRQDGKALPAGRGDDELRVSSTVGSIAASKTAEIQALSKKLQDEGHAINSALCIGEPDYHPAPEVMRAVKDASEAGHTHYTEVAGSLELRREICKYLKEQKQVEYEPSQICVSSGGKQAIYQAVMAVCADGDEVIVPTPCWVSYHDIARLCRAVPVEVKTGASDGYLLRPGPLQAALEASGAKCRILILCNPSNPTGAVIPPEGLKEIAAILRRPEFAHVYVLADEIYEQLVFDTPHLCFASLEGMRERTLLVGGFSKGPAMTGLRLGYLAAAPSVVASVTKLQGLITSCASTISQQAGIVALRDVSSSWTAARVKELREKRDFVIEQLRSIPGLDCTVPEGAFYVFVDLSGSLGEGAKVSSGEEFCKVLLQDYKVALVPGEAFHAPLSVRLSYACSMASLRSAMTAFAACVEALRAPS